MENLKNCIDNLIDEVNEKGQPSLLKAIFSNARKKSFPYKKVVVRPLKLGDRFMYQAECYDGQKVIHENMDFERAKEFSLSLLREGFKQLDAFTLTGEVHVLAAKPENPRITFRSTGQHREPETSFAHNRKKQYIIPEGVPCDFLVRLGVMDETGKVFQKHYAKFRQINRYLEIVDDAAPFLPSGRPVQIIDFGCGKAYLTFALYHYLKFIREIPCEITGLDLKEDVINFCNSVAQDLKYHNLRFKIGDIACHNGRAADMVVTLHACDTATDYALINAVKWEAPIILSVPCCQHEIFSQIKEPVHDAIYKHGILKDRFTEILTDGLRALKLEEAGYRVSLIEFTSLEHTSKNIMIKAVKDANMSRKKREQSRKEYEALCDFYKVTPAIDVMNQN